MTYRTSIESSPLEVAANTMICLIHQTNYLLDRQLKSLEQEFLRKGGFTENLYRKRIQYREKG
jgi:restriction system protein